MSRRSRDRVVREHTRAAHGLVGDADVSRVSATSARRGAGGVNASGASV